MALQIPPHECLVPVLHHYHSDRPSLRDARWGLPQSTEIEREMAAAAAERTLFIVMPLYATSLRAFVSQKLGAGLSAPYGQRWEWWASVLLRMLRAVQHLIRHGAVHGDIKDDQFFLSAGKDARSLLAAGLHSSQSASNNRVDRFRGERRGRAGRSGHGLAHG